MNEENDNIMDEETDDMDDLFAELDNIDTSGDDSGDRDAVTVAKDIGNTAINELTNTDKLMESIGDAVSNSLPNPVSKEVKKVKEIHKEILEPMGKAFTGARKSASGFIRTMTDVLPEIPGVTSTLTRIADAIAPKNEDDDSYVGSDGESEDEVIKNNVSEIFQENNAEARVHEKLEAVNNLSELELSIRNLKNMEVLKDYFITDHYNYIKKSLELQFKQVIALGDIRNRFGIYAEENKELLRAIIKNTGLPDMIKLKNSEVIEHKIKEKAIGKGLDLIADSNFVKNLKDVAEEKIINKFLNFTDGSDMIKDSIEGAAEGLSSLSSKQKADLMTEMGVEWIKNSIIGGAADKLSKSKVGNKVLGKTGKFMQKVTNDPAEFFKSVIPERFKDNRFVEGFTDILNEATSKESVSSINLKNNENLESPAIFDGTTHKAITNIIPNLLSKILNELQGIRTGKFNKNNELRFDFKDNKFKSQETIKRETISELNEASESFQNKTKSSSENIINVLLGKKHSPEDVALFKKGIEKIILNGEPDNIIQWYNDTSVFDNFDKKIKNKIFKGVKKLVLSDSLDSMVKINRISSELDYVRRGANFTSDSLQSLIDRGDVGLISDLGLTNKESTEISSDKVKKLLTKKISVSDESKTTSKNTKEVTNSFKVDNSKEPSFNPAYTDNDISVDVDLKPLRKILSKIKTAIVDGLSKVETIDSKILGALLSIRNASNFESTNATSITDTSSVIDTTIVPTTNNIKFSTVPKTDKLSLNKPNVKALLPEVIETKKLPVITANNFTKERANIINIPNAVINIKEAAINQTRSVMKEVGNTVSDSVITLADNISSKLNNAITTVAETDLNKVFSEETFNNVKNTATKHIDKVKDTKLYKSTSDIANTTIDKVKDTEAYKHIETEINNITNTKTIKAITSEINKIKDPEKRKELKKQLTTTKHKVESGLAYVKENGVIDSVKKSAELLNKTETINNIKNIKDDLAKEVKENGLLNTIKNTTETNLKNVTDKIKNSEIYSIADNKLNDIKKSETFKTINSTVNNTIDTVKNSEAYETVSSKINTTADNVRDIIGDKLDKKAIKKNIKSKFKNNVIEIKEPNEKGKMTKSLLIEIGDDLITIPVNSLNSVTKLTNSVRSQVGIVKTPKIVKELLGDTKNIITSTTKKINEISNSAVGKKINTTINSIKDSEIVKSTENKITDITSKINNVTNSAIDVKNIEQHIKDKYKDNVIEVNETDKTGKISRNLLIDIGDTLLSIPVTALASPVLLAGVLKSQVGFLKTPALLKELLPSATSIMSNIKSNISEQLKETKETKETENNSAIISTNTNTNTTGTSVKNGIQVDNNLSIIEKQKILANKFDNPTEATGLIDNIKNSETYETTNNKISTISNKINNVVTSAINEKDVEQHIKSKYKDSVIEVDEKDKKGKINKSLLIEIGDTLLTIPVAALASPVALAGVIKNQVGFLKTPKIMKELLPSATSIMSNIKNSVNEQLKESTKETKTEITNDIKNKNKTSIKEAINNNTPIDNNLSIIEKQKILANKFNNPEETTNEIKTGTITDNVAKATKSISSKVQKKIKNIINSDIDHTENTDENKQESNSYTSKINETTTDIKSFFTGLFSDKVNLRKQINEKYGKNIDFIKIKDSKGKVEKIFMLPYKKQIIGIPEYSLKSIPTLLKEIEKQVKPSKAESLIEELQNNNKEKLNYNNASIDNFIEYMDNKKYTELITSNNKSTRKINKQLKRKLKKHKNNIKDSKTTDSDIENNEITENDNFITAAIKNNKITNSMFNKVTSIIGVNENTDKKTSKKIDKVIRKLKNIDIKDTSDIYKRLPSSIKPFITKDENGSYIVTLNDDIYKVDEEGLAKLLPTIQEKLQKGEIKLNNDKSSNDSFSKIQKKFKEGGVGGAVNEVASDIKKTIIEKVKENKGISKNALGKTLSVMFNGKNPLKDKLNAVDIAKAFTTGSFKGAFWFGRNVLRPGYKKMFSTVGAVAHEAGKSILTKGFGFSPEVAEGVLGLVEAPFKLVSKAMGGVNTIFKKAKEAFQGFFSLIGKIGKFFLSGAWKLVKKGMGFLTGKTEEEIDASVKAGKKKVKKVSKKAKKKWMKAENSGLLAKLGMGSIRKTVGTAAKLPLMPFKATKTLADTFIITDKEEDNLWLNRKARDAKSFKDKVTTNAKNKFSTIGHMFGKIKDSGFSGIPSLFSGNVDGVKKKIDANGRTVVSVKNAKKFNKSNSILKNITDKIKIDKDNNKSKSSKKTKIKSKKHNESIFSKLVNKLKPKINGVTKREKRIEKIRSKVKSKKYSNKQKRYKKKSKNINNKHNKSLLGYITNGIKNTFSIASETGKLTNNLVHDINVSDSIKPKTIFSKLVNELKPEKVKASKKHTKKIKNKVKSKKHTKSLFGHIADGIKDTFSIAGKTGKTANKITNKKHKKHKKKETSFLNSIVNKLKPKINGITKREKHIEELRDSLEHKNKIKNSGKKKESSSFGLTAIIGLLGTAVGFIKKLFGGVMSIGKHLFGWLPKIGNGIKMLGGHIVSAVTTVAHTAMSIAKGGYNKIKTSLGFGDKTPKSTHIPEKGNVPKTTENKSWFSKIADKTKSMASNIYNKASNVVTTVKNKAINIASNVKDKVVNVASKVKGSISKVLHSAADIVKHPWSSVKEAVSHLVNTPFVKNLATKVKAFLPKMKTAILDKLGPAAGEKALGKIGSMAVPGVGEAMMMWTAGEVAWDMLKHNMSLPSALSDSLIGIDLFKKEAPKAEDAVKSKAAESKDTAVETKTTDKTKDIELGAKAAKETNDKINNIPTDIKTNTPTIPKDTKLNNPDKLQPINPITHNDSSATNLKIQNINKPQPTIIKNKIDDKHTKILAAHGSKIAATTEKQLNVQEEISENLKTLTDIVTSVFDKKGKHIRKVKTPTSSTHKAPVPAPKAAVSSYSTDF